MIVEINLSKHDKDRSTYHSDENQSNQSNFRFVVKTQHVLNRVWAIRFIISIDQCFKQGLLYDFAVESFWRVSDLFLNFWIFLMYLRYHNKRKNKLELIAIVKFCLSSSYPPWGVQSHVMQSWFLNSNKCHHMYKTWELSFVANDRRNPR